MCNFVKCKMVLHCKLFWLTFKPFIFTDLSEFKKGKTPKTKQKFYLLKAFRFFFLLKWKILNYLKKIHILRGSKIPQSTERLKYLRFLIVSLFMWFEWDLFSWRKSQLYRSYAVDSQSNYFPSLFTGLMFFVFFYPSMKHQALMCYIYMNPVKSCCGQDSTYTSCNGT